MTRTSVRLVAALLIAPVGLPATAGSAPVETLPSPPTYVGATIDTGAIVAIIAPSAPNTPAVQAALASLSQATPGSVQAMAAVDSLASAMALAIGNASLPMPNLSTPQLVQAIQLLKGLEENFQAARVNNGGIGALRAQLEAQAASRGLLP